MELKKQINTKNYTTKKHHEQYDKRSKIAKEERKQNLLDFANMSAETLLAFMEDKYEHLDNNNINIQKINNAIVMQIKQIVTKYERETFIKKCRFISMASNDKYTPEEVQQKLESKIFFNQKLYCHIKYVYINGHRYVDMTKDYNSAERCQTQRFICDFFDEKKIDEIDLKRLKVDAISVLSQFISYRNSVEIGLKQ